MCSIAYGEGVEQMLEKMRHRAPDDSGVVGKLGMGRLKIIDLESEGLCPYQYKDHALAFNGEIYNYLELRDELEYLGHSFETQSDTEVLLKSYLQWGIGCLKKFNGMFAFIIQKPDGSLVIARDIAGEKPLYYKEGPFALASENKALDFKGKVFPPAHRATYKDGELKIYRWWKPKKCEINVETAEQDLEDLLEDSVRLRTRSDVPYALYLSGGVDSTLISTFWKFDEHITYKDGDYREEFLEIFPKILYHLDGPIDSFSPFGLWKLAEEAHNKGIKVVLSGEGADELFGGYVRYVPNEFNRLARQKFPSYKGIFPYEDMMDNEFNGNMRELLRMGDRMAGAWGIENRCPFLDPRIIEFAYSLPMELKIKGFDTKVILNRILQKRKLYYRPVEKHGLYCAVNDWLGEKHPFKKDTYRAYQEGLWKSYQ